MPPLPTRSVQEEFGCAHQKKTQPSERRNGTIPIKKFAVVDQQKCLNTIRISSYGRWRSVPVHVQSKNWSKQRLLRGHPMEGGDCRPDRLIAEWPHTATASEEQAERRVLQEKTSKQLVQTRQRKRRRRSTRPLCLTSVTSLLLKISPTFQCSYKVVEMLRLKMIY